MGKLSAEQGPCWNNSEIMVKTNKNGLFALHILAPHVFKEALSINAVRACVYIYIWQLSSFRAPTLWFIDLTVATCHFQYTFLSLCQFFS